MTLDEARLMANVNARAGRLFEDGYRARWAGPGLLAVRNGRGSVYAVDTLMGTCDCPFFLRSGHPCKHVLGYRRLLSRQRSHRRRLVYALLRVLADLDDAPPDVPIEPDVSAGPDGPGDESHAGRMPGSNVLTGGEATDVE